MNLPELKQLAENLKSDVYELCQPEGRMVGSQGHKVAEDFLLRRLKEVGAQPYSGESFELPYLAEAFSESGQVGEHQFLNLVGVIPGTNRDLPPVLVGAHYDSVIAAPCADDNGAAVAITLALASAVANAGGLERDLIVAIFDAEEPPYFCSPSMGSIRFHDDQLDHRGVHFALIFDLVGHDLEIPEEYLSLLDEVLGPESRSVALEMVKNFVFMMGAESHGDLPGLVSYTAIPEELRLVATLNDYVGDMSDHGVFRRAGVPFLFLSCGRWEHYHRVTDTPDRLSYEKMALIAQLSASILQRTAHESLDGSTVGDHSLDFEISTMKESFGMALPLILKQIGLEKLETRSDVKKIVDAVASLGV